MSRKRLHESDDIFSESESEEEQGAPSTEGLAREVHLSARPRMSHPDSDDEADFQEDNDKDTHMRKPKLNEEGHVLRVEGEKEWTGLRQLDGVPITPFNLKEEQTDGHFDRNGHFIYDQDETKERKMDQWLEEYEERFGKEPFELKGKEEVGFEEDAPEESSDDDDAPAPTGIETPLAKKLRLYRHAKKKSISYREIMVRLMQQGETVRAAMQRLKKELRSDDLNQLIEAADHLVERGFFDVYQRRTESFEQSLAIGTFSELRLEWELKHQQTGPGPQEPIHGPYPSNVLLCWLKAGAFEGASPLVRVVEPERPGCFMPLLSPEGQELLREDGNDGEVTAEEMVAVQRQEEQHAQQAEQRLNEELGAGKEGLEALIHRSAQRQQGPRNLGASHVVK
eukprot:gnl/Trimastix_PCT/1708.p1 GENE.gnl/Trimastix_PCT/1708~~gnl/Trimastix_PCT/1708.p1  ORF type:complete len:396 (-),score=96.58 gnl/Trimastix_PCT/1708:68-1255(-)